MNSSVQRLNKRAFFEDLGYEPHPGQLEIHLDNHRMRVVACGVRWGKTLCAAMEALVAAMAPAERSVGWVAAPTYDLATRVFREVFLNAQTHLRHYIVRARESAGLLVLRNMAGGVSEIRTKSADRPVSLLGEGLDWVIVDEASRLKPSIWQEHLSQRLIDKDGWALLISTPNGKGYFHELYQRGQGRDSGFRSWNYPSWTNPLLDPKRIEDERKRIPERVFNQEYGAQFIEGAGAVFRYVQEAATGDLAEPEAGATYFAGLDVAKAHDYTVLIILDRTGKVVSFDRFNRLDWSIQLARVQAATKRFNNACLTMDSTGAGEPIYEAFKKAGCRVRPYLFTSRSKAALIDNLALKLEQRELTLLKSRLFPELIDELEAFEYSLTEHGNFRTGAPHGYHDDCVIALALAAWALKQGLRRRRTPGVGKCIAGEPRPVH